MARSPDRPIPRVLHVVLSLNPGGTERLVLELARRLHADMPAAVCCLDEPGAWVGEIEASGIKVSSLGRQPGFRPGLGRGVAAAARAHGATVIHAHHYSPFVYSVLARPRLPGVRVIYTEHGRLSDAGPSAKRRAVNQLLRHAASDVYAVSEDVKQHLVAEGFSDAQVGVIYNGIDVGPLPTADARARIRRDLGVSDGTFVVGTIARLDPVKDLGTLIDAIAVVSAAPTQRRVEPPGSANQDSGDADMARRRAEPSGSADPRSRDPLLIIIGDGPERAALEARAATSGLTGRVRFLGQRDDAREWLAGCDAYANSSVSEGVSLTILEAMAASIPIVATAVGGTPEVVDDSCGLLVPARDPSSLADALRTLAGDPDLRTALGRGARARVEGRFTLERMVREYEGSYRGSS